MIKKIILLLILLCMIAVPTFAVGGTYTTNNYFYMPAYGAYGAAEFAEYNAYMQIADTQIEANKVLGEAAVDTSGVPVANDIPRFTDLNTIEGLSYVELKAVLDLEIGTDILAQQSIGISNDYLLEVDGTPNSAEYARFTVNGLEGRTEAEFKGDFNLEIGMDVEAHDTTLTDIADGTINENLVNTAHPWADNEVANDITINLATLATTITVTDNEATAENNPICFVAGADPDGGSLGIETDGDLTYNPSTGTISTPIVSATTSITTPIIYGAGSTYLRIGDGATTTHILDTEDDFMVTGKLEIDGWAFFDTGIDVASTSFFRGNMDFTGTWSQLRFGPSNESQVRFNASQTHDCFTLSVDDTSKNFVITTMTNNASNYATAVSADPTLYIYSVTGAGTATDEWISFTHDQTDGVISTGSGDLNLSPATGNVNATTFIGALTGNADTCTTASGVVAESVDSAAYVDASIDHEHLAPDVISGLADVTSADADYIMIWDASDSALKKVDMGEIRGAGGDVTNWVIPQDYATGSGTSGDPWAGSCLSDAYTAASAGDTIYCRAGYYQLAGQLTLAKAINIIGEGMGKTFVLTANAKGFLITADYVSIQNMTLDGDAEGDGVQYLTPLGLDDCDYALIRNVESKNAGYSGINNLDTNRCIYQNLYVHDNYHHGIHPGANTVGRNMYNTYQGIYAWDNGDDGFSDRGSNDATEVEDCYNVYDGIVCWDNGRFGIGISYQKAGVLSNSFTTGSTQEGIYMRDLEDFNIHNCSVTLNGEDGIRLYNSKEVYFTNIIVKNNNCSDNGVMGGIRIDGDSSYVKLTSCRSYDSRTITGTGIAFVDGGAGEDTITMTPTYFLKMGLVAGEDITITGAGQAENNNTFTIVSVVAGTINVATASLTTEAAGASVTITQGKMQVYGLRTNDTASYIELVNCDLRGNLTGRINNGSSAKITGNDIHKLIEDHDYSGIWETEKVGESVVFGELLYFNWTDKEWKKTDADAAATMPGLRIALESKADGAECLMLVQGDIRDDSAFAFAGSMVYASCTPGDITSTAPSASGDQVQRVGVAAHADYFYFSPSLDQGEI